jgi:ABC-type multidrug transport system fused ATPase/permease subunit
LTILTGTKELKKRFQVYFKYLRLLSPYRIQFAISLCSTIVLAFLSMVNPLLAKLTIDVAFVGRNVSLFFLIIAIALGVFLVTMSFQVMENYLNARLDALVRYDLSRSFYKHLLSLPIGFLESRPAGDIIYRASTDVANVANMVLTTFPTFLLSSLKILLFLSITFWLNWKLTVFAIVSFPLLFLNNFLFSERIKTYQGHAQQAGSRVLQAVSEDISGAKLIRSFGKVKSQMRRYLGFLNASTRLALTTNFYKLFAGASATLVASLWSIALSCYAGLMVMSGEITLGALIAVGMYLAYLQNPFNRLMAIYQSIMTGYVSASRLEEYLQVPNEAAVLPSPQPTSRAKSADSLIQGTVEFKNVHFAYHPGKAVLQDCSFRVESGMNVGLVGPSGVGKTTVTKLLARFYDTQQGKILIDNKDLRSFPLDDYRKQLGMVLQSPYLFLGTVDDNIRFGSSNGGQWPAMKDMIRRSVIGDILESLPQGLNTPVGPGGEYLSGGQKQIVAIARALVRNPSLLILDEAVSFLDIATEEMIVDLLRELKKDRTTFIIAHRLSTIRECDMILVLYKGNVVESGKHKDLISKPGLYRNMYRAQFRNWTEVLPKS